MADHFDIDAKVRCGLAFYHLGDKDQVLCFGEQTLHGVTSTEERFHCWVEAEGWLLDFMTPKFRELIRTEFVSKPKMFQKHVSDMVGHPNKMAKAGDFFLMHNSEFAQSMLMPVVKHPGIQDLTRACSQWF